MADYIGNCRCGEKETMLCGICHLCGFCCECDEDEDWPGCKTDTPGQEEGVSDKSLYPANWKSFSHSIRVDRAEYRCECIGECGLHPETNDGPRRCTERHMQPAVYARGKVVLTTAHLCVCDPICAIPEHVKAMCNRCHLRIDVDLHQRHLVRNRRIALEKAGQQV